MKLDFIFSQKNRMILCYSKATLHVATQLVKINSQLYILDYRSFKEAPMKHINIFTYIFNVVIKTLSFPKSDFITQISCS